MSPVSQSSWTQWRAVLLHPWTLFILITLAVFLPAGFNIGPVNDGWLKLGSFLSGSPLYRADISRAFGGFPRDFGMQLGGGSFVGWQAFLFLFTALRGILFYEIVRRLFPTQLAFAVACGLVALFHPADSVYFWVDVTGVHMGLVFALAACLCVLLHMQSGSRAAVLGAALFQLLTCLTYSGFLILIIAFPIGVWLLGWTEGPRPDWRRLLRTVWLPIVYVVVQVLLVLVHKGHEGQVADLDAHAAIAGLGREFVLFLQRSVSWLYDMRPAYLLWALPPVLLAWALTRRLPPAAPAHGLAFYRVLCLGLIGLALACYFPYAVSEVRVGGMRQMFAAGIFLYMLLLLPVFLLLPARFPARADLLRGLLVAAVAASVTFIGLQERANWVDEYRDEERLLSAIAALAPQPAPDTRFVIHLHDDEQAQSLSGFYNRRAALIYALHLMYDDRSLKAMFTTLDAPYFGFDKDQLQVTQKINVNRDDSSAVPYGQLLILDYGADGRLQVLDPGWLQQQAPKGFTVTGYDPRAHLGTTPAANSKVCVMLEKAMRPNYCR